MQTTVRTVRATSTRISSACASTPTSAGPIYAESCDSGGEEPPQVFLLTTGGVASVSIEGGAHVPTGTSATFPAGVRAAALQRPGDDRLIFGFEEHCPGAMAFDASGAVIDPRRSGAPAPMAAQVPVKRWEYPGHPPPGPCELDATQLRLGTRAWSGVVVRRIRTVRRLVGHAFLSCADTFYVHRGGEDITAAILLDAADPGATPPPLPGMLPYAGHPGVFLASSSEGTILARRVAHAWLVVSEEEPEGLAVPLALLENLRARVQL